MNSLFRIQIEVDARVRAIRASRPDWLCGKGCDACCRRLAEVPRLTPPEWSLLQVGLAALPQQRLWEIGREVAELARRRSLPIVCPLLEQASGCCQVYAQRPLACRTYGFYVQRGLGLYCREIEAQVAAGDLAEVVWGNQDAIDRGLAGLGETRTLTEWFADRAEWPGSETEAADD
ncbi:MAG TPA: YkgJ family cysteine cluster protein [Accumulibacter sp.]|uniref:YkgJ family cysteine cluster protein n=1 Tax=Accumulibacter sp. TaxID=2053492 RepID=UPI0025D642CB|nr:YkgJ family cysteine cluster protein [Accumulibacter sp.]MCM8599259.1 YkgJ family cysteine cluster protein [Accumulibacter sp.]MCM8663394.1 YkgJ family cysteine cluster protein [Accumulibacter sp.]HNC52837.1 YkgJ family cysteine cluster protein [Accumulibacter sp.]